MAVQFPPVESASEDGLLAIGGNLDIETLVTAYKNGIFPWPVEDGYPMTWFSPDPRGIIEVSEFRVSKSLNKFLKKHPFEIKFNHDFLSVITRCSVIKRQHESGTWIYQNIIDAYHELFKNNLAYCVSVYKEDKIVGGLYGVCIGEIISGESMFFTETNASKVALVSLIERLNKKGIPFIDTQMVTTIIKNFGGKTIPRSEFIKKIGRLNINRPKHDIF